MGETQEIVEENIIPDDGPKMHQRTILPSKFFTGHTLADDRTVN